LTFCNTTLDQLICCALQAELADRLMSGQLCLCCAPNLGVLLA